MTKDEIPLQAHLLLTYLHRGFQASPQKRAKGQIQRIYEREHLNTFCIFQGLHSSHLERRFLPKATQIHTKGIAIPRQFLYRQVCRKGQIKNS